MHFSHHFFFKYTRFVETILVQIILDGRKVYILQNMWKHPS